MATESQWRAVIEAMAEAAGEADQHIMLEVWPNGTGRLTGRQAIEEWNEEDCAVSALRFGIPIAPDPPASTVKTRFVTEGPAQPLPFPEEPYALSHEGRIELLAQFTAAALTGFASCPEHYTRDEAARRAVETAQTALHAFEAATRESAEKGGE